jgi:hypothetical protein
MIPTIDLALCFVEVPSPLEFSSFIVDHSIVTHLWLSDRLKTDCVFKYPDLFGWIPVGPLGCSALNEVDKLP